MDIDNEQSVDADNSAAPAPTENAEKSMEDTIRDEYRRLTANGASQPDETDDSVTPSDTPETLKRNRGADGRFARSSAAPDKVETAGETQAAPGQTEPPATPASAASDYPNTWKKDFQSEWDKISPGIKSEIKRREQNFLEGIRQYQEPASFGKAIGQEMLPHVDVMRQMGVTPQQLTRDMMGAWSVLVTGTPDQKSQVILNLARQYGIDTSALAAPASTGSDAAQAVSPDLAPVLQRVQGIERLVRQQAEQASRAASEQAMSEVQQFASRADRKHFAAAQETMAQLIGSGQAATLDDAYDKAIWLVPEIREKLFAEQAEKRSQEDAARAAAARKAASVNVAKRGTPPAAPKQGTMEDTIREEYRRLMSQ